MRDLAKSVGFMGVAGGVEEAGDAEGVEASWARNSASVVDFELPNLESVSLEPETAYVVSFLVVL